MVEILLVDDDPLAREYLSIMAGIEGYACTKVEHGGQAIERLCDQAYDLALVDIFMPVKEGIETIIEMRQRFPDTKIIAMSAGCKTMPASQVLDFARTLGADEILLKPFSLDDFGTVTHQVLFRA